MKLPQIDKIKILTPEILFFVFFLINLKIRHFITKDLTDGFLWDEGFYLGLVRHGYSFSGNVFELNNVVFFPLYPLLCQGLKFLLPFVSDLKAMLIVSWIFAYASIRLLFILIKSLYDYKTALYTSLLFLCSPFCFFIFQGFTEALFFALVFGFFYSLEVKKHKYIPLLIIALASATRMYGILLLVIYIVEYFYREDKNFKELILLMPVGASGLIAFSVFQYFEFGDPLLFMHGQAAWGHSFVNGLSNTLNLKKILIHAISFDINNVLFPISLLFVLALFTSVSTIRMPRSFKIFNILLLVFFYLIYNPDLTHSMGRYLTVLFPMFLMIILWIKKYNLTTYQIAVIFLLLLTLNLTYLRFFCEKSIFVG